MPGHRAAYASSATAQAQRVTNTLSLCYDGQSYGSVVPDKFLLVSFNLSDEHETYNALVVVWSGRRSTAYRDERHLTRHSLSAHSGDSLTPHPDSRLYQAKKRMLHMCHPCIGHVTLCCPLASNVQLIVLSEPSNRFFVRFNLQMFKP